MDKTEIEVISCINFLINELLTHRTIRTIKIVTGAKWVIAENPEEIKTTVTKAKKKSK